MIPALVMFYGRSQKCAKGTSLATFLLPIGIFAVLEIYEAGHLDLRLAMLIAAGFVIGGWFGGL